MDHPSESIKFKLARWLALHFGRLCQIDAGSLHLKLSSRIAQWRARSSRSNPSATGAQLKLWPQLVMLVFIYTTIKFCALTYYIAEEYHYEKMLEQIRLIGNATSGEYLRAQEVGLSHSIEMQHYLGAPYRRGGICVACAYHILINLTLFSYLVTLIYDNYIVEFKSHLIDSLLDPQREQLNCLQIIRREVGIFQQSSANSINQVAEQVIEIIGRECECECSWRQKQPGILSDAIGEHAQLIGYLNEFISDSQIVNCGSPLWPINRNSEWLDRALDKFVQVNVGNIIYSLLIDLFLAFGIPHLAGIELYLGRADVLSLVEMFALAEINVITTGYHMSLQLAHRADQSDYLDHLRGELESCVRLNERAFVSLLRGRITLEQMGRRVNRQLVEVLLKYRIFINQMRQNQRSWHLSVFISLDVMFGIPLILNLFSPYAKLNSVRSLGILFSMSVVCYADSMLLPLCKFHLKGQQLYKSLWSLLAHLIQLERRATSWLPNCHKLIFQNSLQMLRNELAHPQNVLDQFAVGSLGFDATYGRIIELHFYYGVVLISLFFEIDSWRKLLGDRLSDPLNLT